MASGLTGLGSQCLLQLRAAVPCLVSDRREPLSWGTQAQRSFAKSSNTLQTPAIRCDISRKNAKQQQSPATSPREGGCRRLLSGTQWILNVDDRRVFGLFRLWWRDIKLGSPADRFASLAYDRGERRLVDGAAVMAGGRLKTREKDQGV